MLLKGMTHAGFFSGTVIYFSLWYCKKQLTLRFAILFGAVSAAGFVSSIVVRTGAFRRKALCFECTESTVLIYLGICH